MKLRLPALLLAALAFSAVAFGQPINQAALTGCYILGTPTTGPAVFNTATGTSCQSAFQVRYFANLTVGDSYIDATNDGSVITIASTNSTATTPNYSTGNICMNVYTFDPAEELVSCCACAITPNGLVSLSAQQDLVSNTLTPASPTAIVVKLLATTPSLLGTSPLGVTQSCNASFPFGGPFVGPIGNNTLSQSGGQQYLAPALHAWGSTIHAAPGGLFHVTETEFSSAALSINVNPTASTLPTRPVGVTDELYRITTLCGFNQGNGSGFGQCTSCRAGGLGAVQR